MKKNGMKIAPLVPVSSQEQPGSLGKDLLCAMRVNLSYREANVSAAPARCTTARAADT